MSAFYARAASRTSVLRRAYVGVAERPVKDAVLEDKFTSTEQWESIEQSLRDDRLLGQNKVKPSELRLKRLQRAHKPVDVISTSNSVSATSASLLDKDTEHACCLIIQVCMIKCIQRWHIYNK